MRATAGTVPSPTAAAARPTVAGSGWVRFLCGFAAIWCALHLLGAGALSPARGVAAFLVVVIVAACVERLLFGSLPGQLVNRLGLGRPTAAALSIALTVSAACLAVYPLLTLLTGDVADLREDWPWLLAGLFAYNGLAEELGWRAYAFGRLRQGRSFRRAAVLTMPLIAATHLPIVATSGPLVGIGAMLVAAVTTVPFARLYEHGRRTIWAPATLHTAIDSFKLVTLPDEATATFSLLLIGVSLIVPLAVLPAISRGRRAEIRNLPDREQRRLAEYSAAWRSGSDARQTCRCSGCRPSSACCTSAMSSSKPR